MVAIGMAGETACPTLLDQIGFACQWKPRKHWYTISEKP